MFRPVRVVLGSTAPDAERLRGTRYPGPMLLRTAASLSAFVVASAASTALAHGPLMTGEVAIVCVDTADAGQTRIVLIALRDLHDGDSIELTDRGLMASGALREGEGADFYEVTRLSIPRGTTIEVRSTSLLAEGPQDQILAYRGRFSAGALDGAWLDALTYGGPWASDATSDATSVVPPALAASALTLPSGDALAYVGSLDGTATEVWARVHDPRNWRTGPRGSFSFPARADVRGGLGDSCGVDAECGSGFCVDSVCCNTACNRDALLRCEWCDFGVTSTTSGTCGVAPRSIVCRSARSGCDAPETCDGVTTTCPSDGLQPAGYTCRRARGECDVAESCDGTSPECPSDAVASSGTVCRPSAEPVCDAAELCDGLDINCGADIPLHDGEPCSTACGGVGICQGALCEADACPMDAGLRDAGRPDAGPRDAGRRDAARSDAAPAADVPLDADLPADAGVTPQGSCVCGVTHRGEVSPWCWALFGLIAARLRRQRGSLR